MSAVKFLLAKTVCEKTASHYDKLIDENNDPVRDPLLLKEYMDKWDGQRFLDSLRLSPDKDVLEIGVGTGRLAIRVCGGCNAFTGIDISPKTIERGRVNLHHFNNCTLICADFMEYEFDKTFDVVYSSLTFIHIADKSRAIKKTSELLRRNGRFVLSVGKSQDKYLGELELFPVSPDEIKRMFCEAALTVENFFETEFAFVVVGIRQ